ncbi:hypothetical protein BJ912DRAFT_36111 [Pholiota molesta]|nr:hypothetical protein BJ912DRAFT_36111 [Pholiota molesta]
MVSQLSEITPNYTTASAVAALAYDILLYSVDEIKYIWSAWSIPKLLYLSSRYYPIIYLSVLLSVKSRANLPQNVYAKYSGGITAFPLVNIILSLRVSALYGNTRKIIAFLSFLFAVEFIGELITTAYLTIPDAAHAISLSGPPYGCDTTVSTNILLVRLDNLAWSVTLFGSFSLFALTVLKLWRYRTKAAPWAR